MLTAYVGSVSDHRAENGNRQVPRVPLPDVGITSIRETCTASCEDITPRSSLLQTHASIPLALLSFGLSLVRGVSAGCDQPLLLAGPSRRYLCESFPECLGPCHGGTWSAPACFFPHVIGLPPYTIEVGLPALPRQNDFMTDPIFETAAISLCSGPPVCLPPRSFLPLRLIVAGQPRLLRPSRTCVVASACIGYANHPPRQLVVWGLTPH